MSALFVTRNCAVCQTQFEYPVTSPRCICLFCSTSKALLFECIGAQKDFQLRIDMQRYEPIYWATYNLSNVQCGEYLLYLRDKDKTMYVGRVGSIFPKQDIMYVRPLARHDEPKNKYKEAIHIVTWENILCVLKPLCS